MKILLAEDEQQLSRVLETAMTHEGYQVDTAFDGQEAVDLAKENAYDLMILDIMMPVKTGIEALKEIRQTGNTTHVIMLTAMSEVDDKVTGLDAGADDYLTKPFSTTELMARIRVAIRHAFRQNTAAVQKVLTVRELSLDLEKRQVTLRGQPLHLTPMEYNLLSLFLRNSGKVLTTRYLISAIWGSGYGEDTQALRALMAGLRRKIEENPAKPRYIVTEIGVGYRLVEQEIQKGPY